MDLESMIQIIRSERQVRYICNMGKSYQVRCPADGKQHVVEVDDDGQVVWCSKEVRQPGCSQECLKRFRTVAFLMHTDVPTFESGELERLTYDQVVARFEKVPFERLPVLSDGVPVGTLALRDVAGWKDNRDFKRLLNSDEWSKTSDHLEAEQYVTDEEALLKLSDPWEKAAQVLLDSHENDAIVVDDDGLFAGVIYARQLLRVATLD